MSKFAVEPGGAAAVKKAKKNQQCYAVRLYHDIKKHKMIYLMALPVILFYLIFNYTPMYGAIIAFQNYNPADGIWGSQWVGLANFKEFFQSRIFGRVLINTLRISVTSLVFGFPAPIILSLLKIEPGGQKDEFELIRERIANTIEEKNLISTALDKQNAIVRRNYLIKMLTGQINYKENISEVLAELLIPFSAEQKFVVLMLSVESYAEFFEGETALSDFEKSELVDFMFENVFTELIQHQNDTGFVLPYSGNIFCIVGGMEIQVQELKEMVRQGQDIFEKNFQIPFSGVISDVNTGFEGIHQAYQQVLEAGEMRMFSGEQDLVLYAEAMQRDSGDSISPLGLNAQKLEALVENGDRDGAAEYLTELMRRQEKRARVSPHAYRFFVFEIIEVLMNLTLTVYGRSDTAAALQEKLMRALDGHMNRGEYRQFFLEVLSKMCAEAGDKTKNNETVARAVRYIEGHYQDDALNISALADVLNVSSKYLSAVFKKEKNTGILDYIGKIRISKAKQLLEETYMNMEDIYKKVGFTNKITFIRIFKKWEGITPSEYRNLRRGSHV